MAMYDSSLALFGDTFTRVSRAIKALKSGSGVLVVDDENRENEGDFVFPADTLTNDQMDIMIRHGSGTVCLCLSDEGKKRFNLPKNNSHNTNRKRIPFRFNIKAASEKKEESHELAKLSHVFSLHAHKGGVLARRGHSEAAIELTKLADTSPAAVICELANPDGSMARLPNIIQFAKQHNMPILTIEDLVGYLRKMN
jgi:3,4-dihydroxy 2-butanone 4-phosphate synthase